MAANYRPISVLSPIAKVFEKIIYSRLNSFFIRNNIICEEQFGFRRGHSTSLAIADIYSNILDNLDRKNCTCAVFLDLKNTYDTINHDILLQKRCKYGIRGKASDLMKSYLTNRIQYTVVDNVVSNPRPIKIGIPEGSTLCPFLFIVYINDLP